MAVAAGLVAVAVLAVPGEAQAQYRRPNFFEQLFGGGGVFQQPGPPPMQQPRERAQPQVDSTRAPPPRKSDKSDAASTTTVMVIGDSFADWLAFGLEDAFSDMPEVGVLRRHKTYSGLIRYENRGDLDWPHVARDLIAKDKPNFIVVMLGLNDRVAIREAPPPRKKEEANKTEAKKDDTAKDDKASDAKEAADDKPDDESGQSAIVAPEAPRGPRGSSEFRSDRWAELYSKKIDEMIAALKSSGAPVIWVGLPSIRGTRSTADALYLNDLFRARAQKAGIAYVDVWDGFVDENNRYSLHGPDVEGQTRRLRAYDGVHFTSYGARKLAHYVDREIRRLMSGRGASPLALPSDMPGPDAGAASGPAARPLVGPVISLTGTPGRADELLGAARAPAPGNDPVAARVLVKGEPVAAPPGRADDFGWPRGAFGTAPASTTTPGPAAAAGPPASPAVAPAPPPTPVAVAPSAPPAAPAAVEHKPPPRRASPQRPPAPVAQHQRPAPQRQPPPPQQRPSNSGGLFGLFR